MKKYNSVLLLCLLPLLTLAQGFSDKTNGIKLNYTKEVVATTLPQITWVSPRTERTNSIQESVTFEAGIRSDVALRKVFIEFTSGGDMHTKNFPVAGSELNKTVNQQLRLFPGENVIKVVAENINGGIVTSVRTVLVGKDEIADAVDINRKDYALIFATDHYENWDKLVNPINDARSIEKILKEKYGFQTEVVEDATNDEVWSKITDYNTRKFNPQDQLFVFFAGHGAFDETLGEGYVVASNSIANDKGRTSYVSHILLRERLNNIQCEHIFLMMDVCFGGTIDPVLAKSRGADVADDAADKQYLVKKLTKRTRKFLTSGSKQYVPDGVPGKHSPFAEKFILALREIGGGTGRILSLLELQTYFLKLQTEPRFGSFGTDDPASDFVFVAK